MSESAWGALNDTYWPAQNDDRQRAIAIANMAMQQQNHQDNMDYKNAQLTQLTNYNNDRTAALKLEADNRLKASLERTQAMKSDMFTKTLPQIIAQGLPVDSALAYMQGLAKIQGVPWGDDESNFVKISLAPKSQPQSSSPPPFQQIGAPQPQDTVMDRMNASPDGNMIDQSTPTQFAAPLPQTQGYQGLGTGEPGMFGNPPGIEGSVSGQAEAGPPIAPSPIQQMAAQSITPTMPLPNREDFPPGSAGNKQYVASMSVYNKYVSQSHLGALQDAKSGLALSQKALTDKKVGSYDDDNDLKQMQALADIDYKAGATQWLKTKDANLIKQGALLDQKIDEAKAYAKIAPELAAAKLALLTAKKNDLVSQTANRGPDGTMTPAQISKQNREDTSTISKLNSSFLASGKIIAQKTSELAKTNYLIKTLEAKQNPNDDSTLEMLRIQAQSQQSLIDDAKSTKDEASSSINDIKARATNRGGVNTTNVGTVAPAQVNVPGKNPSPMAQLNAQTPAQIQAGVNKSLAQTGGQKMANDAIIRTFLQQNGGNSQKARAAMAAQGWTIPPYPEPK